MGGGREYWTGDEVIYSGMSEREGGGKGGERILDWRRGNIQRDVGEREREREEQTDGQI